MTTATFDDHAAGYDAVAMSRVGREYRTRVHHVVTPFIDATSCVLDLGCGTGIDTAWLTTIAHSVHAIDPAVEMVAAATSRTATAENVTVAQGGIASVVGEACFDVVLANFGAINCVTSVESTGRHIARVLRPGGQAVLVTMPRVSPIERLAAIMGRDRERWGRRVNGPTAVAGYEGLTLTYADAGQLAEAMPDLQLMSAQSLGLVLPGFEYRQLLEDRPRITALLARLDQLVSGVGGRVGWGDHIVAVFQKPSP